MDAPNSDDARSPELGRMMSVESDTLSSSSRSSSTEYPQNSPNIGRLSAGMDALSIPLTFQTRRSRAVSSNSIHSQTAGVGLGSRFGHASLLTDLPIQHTQKEQHTQHRSRLLLTFAFGYIFATLSSAGSNKSKLLVASITVLATESLRLFWWALCTARTTRTILFLHFAWKLHTLKAAFGIVFLILALPAYFPLPFSRRLTNPTEDIDVVIRSISNKQTKLNKETFRWIPTIVLFIARMAYYAAHMVIALSTLVASCALYLAWDHEGGHEPVVLPLVAIACFTLSRALFGLSNKPFCSPSNALVFSPSTLSFTIPPPKPKKTLLMNVPALLVSRALRLAGFGAGYSAAWAWLLLFGDVNPRMVVMAGIYYGGHLLSAGL